jgi:hypothetical protein
LKTLKQISKQSANPFRTNQIGEFLFRQLRKELSSLHHESIYVPHIGTFAISETKLRKNIIGMVHTIRKYEARSSDKYVAILRESLRKQLILKNKLAIQSYEQRAKQREKYRKSASLQTEVSVCSGSNGNPGIEETPDSM